MRITFKLQYGILEVIVEGLLIPVKIPSAFTFTARMFINLDAVN